MTSYLERPGNNVTEGTTAILRSFQLRRARALSDLLRVLERHHEGRMDLVARAEERTAARHPVASAKLPELEVVELQESVPPRAEWQLAQREAAAWTRATRRVSAMKRRADKERTPGAAPNSPATADTREAPKPAAPEVMASAAPTSEDREVKVPNAGGAGRLSDAAEKPTAARKQTAAARKQTAAARKPTAIAPKPTSKPPAAAREPTPEQVPGSAAAVGSHRNAGELALGPEASPVDGLSRYVLGDPIGEDDRAICYRALDLATAVNVILVTHPLCEERARIAEGRMGAWVASIARSSHPGIPRVTDWGRGRGSVYYAVATDASATLEQLLQADAPIPFIQLLRILLSVASALDWLHHSGLPHGDLRPNCILVRDEENGAAVVGAGTGALLSQGVSGRSWVRSAAYRAPELWGSDEGESAKADQYALAVIAHEIITGRRRSDFDPDTRVVTVDPIDVPPGTPLRQESPLHVNAALSRALTARPDRRFPSCGEFIAALRGEISLEPEPKRSRGFLRLFGRDVLSERAMRE